MDTADAARCEHRDPGKVSEAHGRAHRGRGQASSGQERSEVARPGLRNPAVRIGEALEERAIGADNQASILESRGRRSRSRLPDRGLGGEGRLEVVRHRQALGDEARLEGHDGTPGIQRGSNLVGDEERSDSS